MGRGMRNSEFARRIGVTEDISRLVSLTLRFVESHRTALRRVNELGWKRREDR
jgi:hypothetical protein